MSARDVLLARLLAAADQRDALLAAAPLGRRRFLAASGASVVLAVLAACDSQGPEAAQPLLEWVERRNEALERRLMRHTALDVAPRDLPLAGDDFPLYHIEPRVPVWDEAARGPWRLRVHGLVARPLTLSRDDLTRLRGITQRVDHFCVEGWTAVAWWTGVRVRELARLAGVRPDARYVDFRSFDAGYHESWDLESALHPQTLVAYGIDGHLLGPGHGAPARLHSPVKLGYKCVKYLTDVVFMAERNGGYWSDRGYEWYAGT